VKFFAIGKSADKKRLLRFWGTIWMHLREFLFTF